MILPEATLFGASAIILLLFVCEFGQVRLDKQLSIFFHFSFSWSAIWIRLERLTNSSDKIDNRISQFSWYLFPIELRRALPTVMLCTQHSFVIKCFGNVLCAREQIRKISAVRLPTNTCHKLWCTYVYFNRCFLPLIHTLWCCVDFTNEFGESILVNVVNWYWSKFFVENLIILARYFQCGWIFRHIKHLKVSCFPKNLK